MHPGYQLPQVLPLARRGDLHRSQPDFAAVAACDNYVILNEIASCLERIHKGIPHRPLFGYSVQLFKETEDARIVGILGAFGEALGSKGTPWDWPQIWIQEP